LKLAARVGILNDDFFFSAPQLKRDPLGSYRDLAIALMAAGRLSVSYN